MALAGPGKKDRPSLAGLLKVISRFENVAAPGPVRLMGARSWPETRKSYQVNIIAKLENLLNLL
jgi:hypothetical protein